MTRQELFRVDPLVREATVLLVPVHKRIHVLGGDIATIISGWGVRGEAAYTLTTDRAEDPEIDDPYFRFTGGVNRTFSRIPVGESLFVILQYGIDAELPQRGASNQPTCSAVGATPSSGSSETTTACGSGFHTFFDSCCRELTSHFLLRRPSGPNARALQEVDRIPTRHPVKQPQIPVDQEAQK